MAPPAANRILILYDGSSASDRALGFALERAGEIGATITILAVVPPRLWRAKRGQFQIPPHKHDEEFARAQIARAKATCRAAGIRSEGRVRTGAPVRVVSEEAGRGYRMLVLGNRGSPTGAPSLAALVSAPGGCEVVVIE